MVKIEAFIILNGHKDNFPNNPTCRLINPTRSEFGKVSKQLLAKIYDTVVRQTNINLWRNTVVVINWSCGNRAKDKCSFISFDIVNFYLSINAELINRALDYASKWRSISEDQKHIIMHAKKSILVHCGSKWKKMLQYSLTTCPSIFTTICWLLISLVISTSLLSIVVIETSTSWLYLNTILVFIPTVMSKLTVPV